MITARKIMTTCKRALYFGSRHYSPRHAPVRKPLRHIYIIATCSCKIRSSMRAACAYKRTRTIRRSSPCKNRVITCRCTYYLARFVSGLLDSQTNRAKRGNIVSSCQMDFHDYHYNRLMKALQRF